MNPVRKQRLLLAGLVLAGAAVAAVLITQALQQNMSYLHTPSEAREGSVPSEAVFRLGGVVKEGSVKRKQGTLEVGFAITDRVQDFPVRFSGILPDLFREGQSVIARGRLEGDVFVADEVLAKHDETYMPPEVAEKIAESHAKAAQLKAAEAAQGGGQP
ncbi:cytochrome c maturation protein CcmE [Pseudomarimonas salicorniae]|uniref:Cytochrome c-type biogenesis protein CcmE n=1 Tax=Pseudomarimonas salicorniae TaxID=2933270 RepID=A0ABT0GMF5_9GAMM|nr:cytochrome c maturation protein CcmE [Lysobacter sp. CAU 1642]MCK7595197.1 cytochrome c maturation protein CcmE [Lysobacter sp. CAU 1642]